MKNSLSSSFVSGHDFTGLREKSWCDRNRVVWCDSNRVVRRFSAASKSFISCHHEGASAPEGSAFLTFPAASSSLVTNLRKMMGFAKKTSRATRTPGSLPRPGSATQPPQSPPTQVGHRRPYSVHGHLLRLGIAHNPSLADVFASHFKLWLHQQDQLERFGSPALPRTLHHRRQHQRGRDERHVHRDQADRSHCLWVRPELLRRQVTRIGFLQ